MSSGPHPGHMAARSHQIPRTYMTADYELRYSLPMTDRSQREIAALEVEAAMAEAHAKKLSKNAPNLADPEQQREIAALVKEETDRAQTIRGRIRLLRDQV
jgi:hypothetical protein